MSITIRHYVLDRAGQRPLPVRIHISPNAIVALLDEEGYVIANRRARDDGVTRQAWFVSQQNKEAMRIARKPAAIECVLAEVQRRAGGVLTRLRRPLVIN